MNPKKKSKTPWVKKIIHIDMDAFYASVEQLDHPEWKGKPIIVGGDPKRRGVVSTCSYEARKFGVHSAMASARAAKLCPDGIFVRPRMDRYAEISDQVMAVFRRHTPRVEQVSLDEAYLDVTSYRFGIEDPVMIARLIKQNIYALTHLTASAGVASNMFLAKIASAMNKPDGLTVIEPAKADDFLKSLAVRKLPGVGPVTEAKLVKMGLLTCDDLLKMGERTLYHELGKQGGFLFQRALGHDDREVEPHGESLQVSTEETFEKDVLDVNLLTAKLAEFSREIFEILRERGRRGRTLVLKVKYFDFEQITRSVTLGQYPETAEAMLSHGLELLKNKTLAGKKPIRLIGLGISGLRSVHDEPVVWQQGELFEGDSMR